MRRFHSYDPVDADIHFCVPRVKLVEDCLNHAGTFFHNKRTGQRVSGKNTQTVHRYLLDGNAPTNKL